MGAVACWVDYFWFRTTYENGVCRKLVRSKMAASAALTTLLSREEKCPKEGTPIRIGVHEFGRNLKWEELVPLTVLNVQSEDAKNNGVHLENGS